MRKLLFLFTAAIMLTTAASASDVHMSWEEEILRYYVPIAVILLLSFAAIYRKPIMKRIKSKKENSTKGK